MVMLMMALRGAGDAMTPLWFMIVAVLLDSGLNPVFILGLGPAPRLGIAGSATATVIANYVGLIALLVYIYARDLPLRLRGAELRYLLPDPAILKARSSRKGLPMGLQMIVISSSALATDRPRQPRGRRHHRRLRRRACSCGPISRCRRWRSARR